MSDQEKGLSRTMFLGLGVLLLSGTLGTSLLLLASAHGAPGWLADLHLFVAIGLVAVYATAVMLPLHRALREQRAAREQLGRLERALVEASGSLQSGDLVATLTAAEDLPPRLASAVSAAARALGSLVQQILSSSVEVAAAGTTVHVTSGELASGSSQQAAAVVEITATTEELARTAAQIATNAAGQAELAAGAERSGDAGALAVDEAAAGVEEVLKRISGIAGRADTLGTRSKEIYRVLELITEIAQETHILSLNAAIEAAAAGEHGRRFAVVAEEVRRLAQRSQESVLSVRALLDDFVGSIRATVVATEEGSKEAARVLVSARAAAAAISELRGALADTARAAREISLATGQQRTASDQVVLTLKEVSLVIRRMAEGLKQFSGTAERLNQLALGIQLLTQSFHLDSPRSLKHLAGRWASELGARGGHWEALDGHLAQLIAASPFVELVYVVDAQGTMAAIAISPEWAAGHDAPNGVTVGANFGDRPWFQTTLRERRIILTPLYDSLLTGDKCFTVGAPILDAAGKVAGVLGLDVNVKSWSRI
jgi:methyl-accepting chemotaxis protein